jgi:hypothetical protein
MREKERKKEFVPEINLGLVNYLKRGNPSTEELKKYYALRDKYFAHARKRGIFISDFIALSPISTCYKWTRGE